MCNLYFFWWKGDEAPVPEDGIKPTFTERPVIRQSEDGEKITFECRCVGDPDPTVQWWVAQYIENEWFSLNTNFFNNY